MADFYIKKNTTLATLDARLISGTGARANLTGASVQFRMRKLGSGVNVIDRPATIVDPVQGEIRYQWQGTDTSVVGDYEAEFEVTFPDTNTRIFPSSGFIKVKVTETLD